LGETKEPRQKDRAGESPDRELPIDNYENLTVAQIESPWPERKHLANQFQKTDRRDVLEQRNCRLICLS
jgi:hypothetical protein